MANSPRIATAAMILGRRSSNENWTNLIYAAKAISKTATKGWLESWEQSLKESISGVENSIAKIRESGQTPTDEVFLEQFGRAKIFLKNYGNNDLASIATLGLKHGAIAIYPSMIRSKVGEKGDNYTNIFVDTNSWLEIPMDVKCNVNLVCNFARALTKIPSLVYLNRMFHDLTQLYRHPNQPDTFTAAFTE